MALTKCEECGHQISKSATQCPNCGAKIKRTSLFTKIVAGFFVLVFVMVLANQGGTDSSSSTASPGATTRSGQPPLTPEEQADLARMRQEQQAQALGLRWRYSENKEAMGRGTVKHAQVRSLNEVEFDFPYRGAQRATLFLRIHPKFGKDVILQIEKGQFRCGIDGCRVAVKFDDGKPVAYSATEPSDNSSTAVFLGNYNGFVAKAKKAKRAYIEAEFFQEGLRVFEFDVSELNW